MKNFIDVTPYTATLEDGQRIKLQVGKLKITPLIRFCHLIAEYKTPELVALCIDKDLDFINELSLASFTELAKLAAKINFPSALILAKEDPIMATMLGPILNQMAVVAMTAEDLGKTLKNSSLSQSLTASVEATGSESVTPTPSPA